MDGLLSRGISSNLNDCQFKKTFTFFKASKQKIQVRYKNPRKIPRIHLKNAASILACSLTNSFDPSLPSSRSDIPCRAQVSSCGVDNFFGGHSENDSVLEQWKVRSSTEPRQKNANEPSQTVQNWANSEDAEVLPLESYKPIPYRNKFLWLMSLRVRIKKEIERYFRSELLRRMAVTIFFIFLSRAGHFVPIPGYNRESLQLGSKSGPQLDNLELAMVGNDMPLNLFTLGIGPILVSSAIVSVMMQLKLVPRWNRLREEGKAGMDTLKKDMWLISGGFSFLAGLITAAMNRTHSLSSSSAIGSLLWPCLWLTSGALIYHWISDTISDSGFGQGPSVLISIGIFSSCASSMASMLRNISQPGISLPLPVLSNLPPLAAPLLRFLAPLGQHFSAEAALALSAWLLCFLVMTLAAALLLCAKTDVELLYFDVDFQDHGKTVSDESSDRAGSVEGSSEVEEGEVRPYAPFTLAPQGVSPVFYAHYVCILPKLLDSLGLGLPVEIAPSSSSPVGSLLYYTLFALTVITLNCADTSNIPSQLSVYLIKIGARVRGLVRPAVLGVSTRLISPILQLLSHLTSAVTSVLSRCLQSLLRLQALPLDPSQALPADIEPAHSAMAPPRPGQDTQDYLQQVQDSTRFVGGVLLALLSLGSNSLDSFLGAHFKGSTIGFTSMLIIVGSIISMRRTYEAYQQMPELEKVIARYKFTEN